SRLRGEMPVATVTVGMGWGQGRIARIALTGCLACLSGAVGMAKAQAAVPYPGIPDPGGNPHASAPVPPPAGKFLGVHEPTAEAPTHGWSAAQLADVTKGSGANL